MVAKNQPIFCQFFSEIVKINRRLFYGRCGQVLEITRVRYGCHAYKLCTQRMRGSNNLIGVFKQVAVAYAEAGATRIPRASSRARNCSGV